jgi:hypothetical protein
MSKAHFCSLESIKSNTQIDTNVQEKDLISVLKTVEQIYLQELLSPALYNRLIDGIAANSLTEKEKTLIQNYILDYIYAACELLSLDSLIIKITNFGVWSPSPDHTVAKQKAEMTVLRVRKEKTVNYYAGYIKDYINTNLVDFLDYNGGIGAAPKKIINYGFYLDDDDFNRDVEYNRRSRGGNSGLDESI